MKITKAASRITISLLCAVLIFNGLPLNAASAAEGLRHEAFMRGGKAISTALKTLEPAPVATKAFDPLPPAPPAPVPPPQAQSSSSGMSKPMWLALIGGFTASGILLYKIANGQG